MAFADLYERYDVSDSPLGEVLNFPDGNISTIATLQQLPRFFKCEEKSKKQDDGGVEEGSCWRQKRVRVALLTFWSFVQTLAQSDALWLSIKLLFCLKSCKRSSEGFEMRKFAENVSGLQETRPLGILDSQSECRRLSFSFLVAEDCTEMRTAQLQLKIYWVGKVKWGALWLIGLNLIPNLYT